MLDSVSSLESLSDSKSSSNSSQFLSFLAHIWVLLKMFENNNSYLL